uniref:Subtilisin inhibitor 1 n=1 Tax=Oryza brachyantha TaxID=4533 RepID=J3NC23_ORYBR
MERGGAAAAACGGVVVVPPAAAAVKDSWPELVGVSSEAAKEKIREERPEVDVQVVPGDAFVTMDYNAGRVRVFVDSDDKVARAPKIG